MHSHHSLTVSYTAVSSTVSHCSLYQSTVSLTIFYCNVYQSHMKCLSQSHTAVFGSLTFQSPSKHHTHTTVSLTISYCSLYQSHISLSRSENAVFITVSLCNLSHALILQSLSQSSNWSLSVL